MTDILLVYITTPGKEEAKRIAGVLIEENLAACANIIPAVDSLYRWQGELRHSEESLLLLKTRKKAFSRLAERVKEIHPYELPCIVALPLADGLPGFLDWAAGEVVLKQS